MRKIPYVITVRIIKRTGPKIISNDQPMKLCRPVPGATYCFASTEALKFLGGLFRIWNFGCVRLSSFLSQNRSSIFRAFNNCVRPCFSQCRRCDLFGEIRTKNSPAFVLLRRGQPASSGRLIGCSGAVSAPSSVTDRRLKDFALTELCRF